MIALNLLDPNKTLFKLLNSLETEKYLLLIN